MESAHMDMDSNKGKDSGEVGFMRSQIGNLV